MKHSIRFIQSNYSRKGTGTTILILRGMEVREYKYSAKRFDAILDAKNSDGHKWEVSSFDAYISFARIYPE